jgi:putative flippase GtrA
VATAQQLKKLLTDPVESVVLQVPRALVASVISALLDFAVLVFLVEGAGWHAAPAAVVGYLVGGVLQYVLCSIWVFSTGPANHATGFVTFTVLSLVGLGVTWLAMVTLHDWARFPYPVAKIVGLGLAFTWNFASRKFLLFRSQAVGN